MSLSLARPLLLCLALAVAPAGASALAEPASLRVTIEDSGVVRLGGREVDLAPLREFYRQRAYRPAWETAERTESLLAEIKHVATVEGLSPDEYTLPAAPPPGERDLLMSDILARFGRDLSIGRVPPSKPYGGMGPETRPAFDPTAFLTSLASGKDLSGAATALPAPYAGYLRLRQAADRHRAIIRAGGWPTIPDGPALKPGMDDPRVTALRKRLIASGDLDATHGSGTLFDDTVTEAVKKFQTRNGLDADGALGRQTLATLNVPAEKRLAQLHANMERWRWMPRGLASVHVFVNLPAARLQLVEDGEVTMAMRVVVGDVKHPTPSMATSMSSVVLNPTWTIPTSIASKEILPKLRKDPNYLAANNIRILDAFPDESPMTWGQGVDWGSFQGAKFPYRLRQKPGPDNALGYVKFNLKDSDDIYLHDTPSRTAFTRSQRALSHGCVRVERPIDLAERLLGTEWQGKVGDTILEAETRTLRLERQVAVYLLYFTAWADGDGQIHFRDDLYGHDGRLRAALKRTRPSPGPARVATDERRPRL